MTDSCAALILYKNKPVKIFFLLDFTAYLY